ncbi:hypothetical protein PR202_gb06122 [Eleusine coracana subsp. coracana]|uniref:Uncharacterized protein n=1 Tax=Eleusine coracana subsp. coracana TaxID=191504 RepID=A0AAV5E9H9_ELECO|nr:hypothetical protein PR202_gb06122 [Eleusine coracana subsp. coracana]
MEWWVQILTPGPNAIIQNVCALCGSIKCIVTILVFGRPLLVKTLYLGAMDALGVAWLPGMLRQGVKDVLSGDYGFTG